VSGAKKDGHYSQYRELYSVRVIAVRYAHEPSTRRPRGWSRRRVVTVRHVIVSQPALLGCVAIPAAAHQRQRPVGERVYRLHRTPTPFPRREDPIPSVLLPLECSPACNRPMSDSVGELASPCHSSRCPRTRSPPSASGALADLRRQSLRPRTANRPQDPAQGLRAASARGASPAVRPLQAEYGCVAPLARPLARPPLAPPRPA